MEMITKRTYLAIAEDAQDGPWSAYVPDLPSCTAGGATCDAALENIRFSIQLWLEETTAQSHVTPEARAMARQIAAIA
jgi:predicted RNase H-like HicB family nuclease